MIKNRSRLFLPEITQNRGALVGSYYGDPAQQYVHSCLANATLEQINDAMTNVHTIETPGRNRIQYAELSGSGEDDPKNAHVMFLPYGNGWSPHIFIRALQAQAALGDDKRMLIFPNATPGNKPYALDKEEQKAVAEGRLDVVAEKFLRAAEALGVVSIEALVGYSQGASVGGAAARRAAENGTIQINDTHLGDPANAMNRGHSELRRDFMKSGSKLVENINNAGIPALSEAQHTRGGLDIIRYAGGLARVAVGTQIPENKTLHNAMSYNTFVSDLSEALRLNPELMIALLNTERSLIYPKSVADKTAAILMAMYPGRVISTSIKDSTHTFADNTTAYAASLGDERKKMHGR